jgi:tetratricopeptide (TPR) repeat protein
MEQPVAPRKYNPELPLHIERAVLKALAKQRTERHADVSAFIEALRTSINSKIRTYFVSQPTTSDPVPKTKEQWMNKGNVCFKAKHYVDALAAYEHILRLDPNPSTAWHHKGRILKQLGRFEEAQRAYKRARELGYTENGEEASNPYVDDESEPDHFFDYEDEILEYPDDYEDHWEITNSFEPNNDTTSSSADTFNEKGILLVQQQHFQEALLAFEQVIHLPPNFTAAWRNKAHMLWRLNRMPCRLLCRDAA